MLFYLSCYNHDSDLDKRQEKDDRWMDEAHGCVFRFLTCVNQAEPQNIALLLDDFSDNFTFVTQAV